MTAILSTTIDDLYLFNLPFAAYSWWRIGVPSIIFWTREFDQFQHENKRVLAFRNCPPSLFYYIDAPERKAATYAQCARLYAAGIQSILIDPDEHLITSDADMAVFDAEWWHRLAIDDNFHIMGNDLVPPEQFPMCYIVAKARLWANAMQIFGMNPQQKLDQLLLNLKADNFRGNYWAKDQETAYRHIFYHNSHTFYHSRAKEGTQFATRRADREGWPDPIPPDILDAHLPRPGYLPENFGKILALFKAMYPDDDLEWMTQYYNDYIKLLI